MGFDITSEDGLFTGYLSYNFSKFSDYWYIKKHLYGHKASTIIKYLNNAINKLKEEGISPVIKDGEDGWTPNINVFMYHLNYFLETIQNIIKGSPSHINVRYWSDGCGEVNYDDCESEPDISEEQEESEMQIDDGIAYFRHPIHGNMKIDSFAKASEVYTMMVINNDPRASVWLEYAKAFNQRHK